MIGASMAVRPPKTRGLAQMAIDAIRRAGGTVLLAGLARNYFDSAGTTPATVDNPVGLVLDAAGTVGPNVFADATVVFGGESTRVSVGVYRVYSSAGVYSSVSVGAGLTPYKTYRLRFYQDTATAGTLAVDGPAGAVTGFTGGVGEKECVITMTATTTVSIKRSGGVTDIQISNLRIEELTGQHATQPTTGSKPTLRRGLVNQLLWSGDFSNAAWSKSNASISSVVSGSLTVNKLIDNATNGAHYVNQSATPANGTNTFSARLKADGKNFAALECSGQFVYFDLASGTVGLQNNAVGEIQADGDGWYICSITFTTTAVGKGFFIYTSVSAGAGGVLYAGDGTSGILLHRAALFTGTVTAQQILAAGGIPLTTTAPASSALGNYWWQFSPDAPGDYLQTAITTGNEGWVCAGVNSNSYASAKTIFWTGANAPSEVGATLRVLGGGSVQMVTCDGVAQAAVGAGTSAAAGTPQVIEGGWNATTLRAAVNGSEATAPNTRGGASTQTAKIGDNFSGQWFNGSMSAIVICPTLPPAADRALIRAWVAKRQGQTL